MNVLKMLNMIFFIKIVKYLLKNCINSNPNKIDCKLF